MTLLDPTGHPTRRNGPPPNVVDELSYCDDEVKAIFHGKVWPIGLPTQVQLIFTIRKLIDTITAARR